MPPKRNYNRSKNRTKQQNQNKESVAGAKNQSNEPVVDAMADCVFPPNIMHSILSRLPVKPLVRFKSVCKQWCNLFSSPNFIKLHYRQFSNDPENQNFMIYSLSETYNVHTMSLFRIESDEQKPMNLDHPYPEIFFRMDFVGCCNGLICMGCPPLGQGIVLWNPALRLFKFVRLSKVDFGATELVSLGFGYDEEADDFKVVRIVCLSGRKLRVGVEVYSTKSDSWKTIKAGFQFRVLSAKNDAVVGGNPHWISKANEKAIDKSHIVWFDVKKMVFEMVPSLNLQLGGEGNLLPLMDWKGSLAAIMCNETRERDGSGSVYVLVFDKDQKTWNMNHIFGPLDIKMYRCLQCSMFGKIIGVCFDGKLFVFDPKTGHVKMVEVDEAQMLSFQIYEYNESMVDIKGMQPVVVKKDEEKEEDEVDPTAGPSIDFAGFFKSYLQLNGGGHVGNYPVLF
ncbi:hypothetical protein OROHE_000356 [Orobanche hederae]